ncbi:MAG TPA: ArsI/CadI family heavy metal resistance metalloenzyme [Xanthomonadales bacterium]|nr:ArsI/CadI family heavy metal resistance metalloenzyme [Xanthomonadales bacterium]
MSMRVHISLPASDLGASLQFYEQMFGQPPSKLRDDYANFRLNQPPIHLALEQAGGCCSKERQGSHSHFGVELPDRETFADWRERLRLAGAEGRDEKDAECCYARADKVWLSDPDGNSWEVWVRTGEADSL